MSNLPRTIDEIHESLSRRIKRIMPWDEIYTRGALTQVSESKYQSYIRQAILEEGGTIGSLAGSQSSKDIREVRYPEINETLDIEIKKIDKHTGNFCLNDTLPNGSNVFYIFLRVSSQRVDVRKASELLDHVFLAHDHYTAALDELSDCVEQLRSKGGSAEVYDFRELFRATIKLMEVAVKTRLVSLFDYGELFKFTTTFGFFISRPRPNWFLHSSVLDGNSQEWVGNVPKKKKEIVKEIGEFFHGKWPRKNSSEAKKYDHFCGKNDSISQLTIFLESLTQQASGSGVEEQRSLIEQPDLSMNPPSHSPSETPVFA